MPPHQAFRPQEMGSAIGRSEAEASEAAGPGGSNAVQAGGQSATAPSFIQSKVLSEDAAVDAASEGNETVLPPPSWRGELLRRRPRSRPELLRSSRHAVAIELSSPPVLWR